jgi:hypothetical protein
MRPLDRGAATSSTRVDVFPVGGYRKIRGYYDHALAGNRAGQRAISLNKQWRAIFTLEKDTAKLVFVAVHEVTPHKY